MMAGLPSAAGAEGFITRLDQCRIMDRAGTLVCDKVSWDSASDEQNKR